jgi:hypothetical protein
MNMVSSPIHIKTQKKKKQQQSHKSDQRRKKQVEERKAITHKNDLKKLKSAQ